MGRSLKNSMPQMRLHSGSGHARVRINGIEHWLGRFGSPEAQAAYDRLIAEYLSDGRLSSSYHGMLQAVNALRPFGKYPAAAFGPRCLRQVVERRAARASFATPPVVWQPSS